MSLDFIPALNSLTCNLSLLQGFHAVCRFAPETIRVKGRLSSNIYELLISHRVKSRTRDLRALQCWLCQHRTAYLVALLQWVTHCRTVKEEVTALCRTFKQCILCVDWVIKHSCVRSLMLASSQISQEQILPLNDLRRPVF